MKNIETRNGVNEINIIEETRKKVGNLQKEIGEEKQDTIKLKNYKINNYGDSFSINIDNTHGLTIKIIDNQIVFDAKHEGFIDEDYFHLENNEIIDNGNIDMINRYLKSCNLKLITKDKDIETLNNLFKNLSKNLSKEN